MRAAGLVALLLGGCDGGVKVSATFPDLGEAKSILVAVRSEEGIEVETHDRRAGPLRLVASESAVVELLAYDSELEALGLVAGKLVAQPGGRHLPAPAKIYEASLFDALLGPWELKMLMSAELADFSIAPLPSQCARFEIEAQLEIPFTTSTFVAADRVFGVGPAGLTRFSPEGAEKVPLDASPMLRGATVDPSGIAWLSADDGSLWKGEITTDSPQIEQVFTTTSGDSMTWLAAGENEVFGLSQYGVLERFDGTASRVLHRFPRDHTLGAGIAYRREGELVAVHQVPGVAVRYRDGNVETEVVPEANLIYFNTVAEVPDVGTVIASDEGHFFVSDGQSWSPLGDSLFSLRVLTIRPTEDGFLWGGEFGAVGEYRRDGGFCAPEVLHPESVWHIREAGGLTYLLSRGDDGMALMVVLRRI